MMNAQKKECCMVCTECRSTCLETVKYCLEKGGALADSSLIVMLLEMSQLCQTCADFCAMGSQRGDAVHAACAKLGEECAKVLDRFTDAELKKCAAVCRRCAQSCRAICATQGAKVVA